MKYYYFNPIVDSVYYYVGLQLFTVGSDAPLRKFDSNKIREVDDVSSLFIYELCNAYSVKRVTISTEKDYGLYYSVNLGCDRTVFIDDDGIVACGHFSEHFDYTDPDILEKLHEFIRSDNFRGP